MRTGSMSHLIAFIVKRMQINGSLASVKELLWRSNHEERTVI